ncbi:hypothetical protein SETIT_2G019000v2 [Setaria italica]|uniref:F-box domain-containing protein n=2 Tax=Setaria italica TaxID=4555 RepID=A0A368PUK0_SETIT|nr:hypothetical protein SETIT_2G019000v2 [Setaria italica]
MEPPLHPHSSYPLMEALMEELIEEILLRTPPDEPAYLMRATLVCKAWRIILFNRGFLRRYREFHKTPPLLGYLFYYNTSIVPQFVPISLASTFSPPEAYDDRTCLDYRHGRAIYIYARRSYIIWDPITGDKHLIMVPATYHHSYYTIMERGYYCTATVLCAVDGCDHLNCHGGPFHVIFVETYIVNGVLVAWTSMYSSATCTWSTSTSINVDNHIDGTRCLLIGASLYVPLEHGISILKYDLSSHGLSLVNTPRMSRAIMMKADDGGLGFAVVLENCIYLMSWEASANGIGGWAQQKAIELETLLPKSLDPSYPHEVIGYVEGTHTIFISTDAGLFTLELKSGLLRKVGKRDAYYSIIPYTNFYTPDGVCAQESHQLGL